MDTTVRPIPEGMHSLTPHIVCRDASAAMDFYVRAFGARAGGKLTGTDGKLMHGLLWIGDSALMLVDEQPDWGMSSPLSLKGSPVVLHLYVEDVDAALARAVDAGATLVMAAADMFWGDRYGQVRDPYGHLWSIATHVRDVSPADIEAAAKAGCPGG